MNKRDTRLRQSQAGTSKQEAGGHWKGDAVTLGEEVDSTRNRALLAFSAEAVQDLGEEPLMVLQAMLQHGATLGRWQTPRKWVPLAQPSLLDIDLRARVLSYLPKSQQEMVRIDDEASQTSRRVAEMGGASVLDNSDSPVQRLVTASVLLLTRYLVICRIGAAGIGKKAKGRSLDPSTLVRLAYQQLPRLLSIGLSKRLTSLGLDFAGPNSFFDHVEATDLKQLSLSERKCCEAELKRMQVLGERGCWVDIPATDASSSGITCVAGPAEEPRPQQRTDPHMPLPDDYIAEMGRCSLWLIRDLGPSLLAVTREIRSIWLSTHYLSVGPGRVAQLRDAAVRKLLNEHAWLGCEGQAISTPPFNIRLSGLGKGSRVKGPASGGGARRETEGAVSWRPRVFVDVVLLLKLMQMAHFFVVGLSMGARKSELVTLERDCLRTSSNGMSYADGRTWKLVDRHEGTVRDWVLPDMAMQAIEQQVKLVTLLDDVGRAAPRQNDDSHAIAPVHLWAEIGGGQADRVKPMRNTQSALRAYAKALGMSAEPGGQSLRVHRFRKSIARLVALALTQAPKVLQDVFGHKNIEMTLYYILTDKDLQVDVERVARELRVMKAKEAVEAMVAAEGENALLHGGFGGPASIAVAKAIHVHRDSLHRRGEEWGADSAMELAEILTLQGKAWHLSRPGIICTKFPGTEAGPCNKSKGAPEPARCQTHCSHRIEEPFLRDDVDGSIRSALLAYQEAGERGDELAQALWKAQVRLHLGRFEDLRAKWMKDPGVRSLAGAAAGAEEVAA